LDFSGAYGRENRKNLELNCGDSPANQLGKQHNRNKAWLGIPADGAKASMETAESKTVVIIEDEPDTLEMFSEMMHLGGFQVHKSFGGTAAVDLLRQVQPDAVVMDIMMPEISGIDLLGIIRKDPSIAHIPVLLVSAKSLPIDIRRGLDAGANGYLTKPITYQDLKNAIHDIFDRVRDDQVKD
jgi:CheY-like chemotaxis protein